MGILLTKNPTDLILPVTGQCHPQSQIPRLDFELTPACDHKCAHCYNVWNAHEDDPQGSYPKGQLRGDEFLAMMEKIVLESGADHITITGGEPLLHKDAMAIVHKATQLVSSVQIISNGSHITPQKAQKFKEWGVNSIQLTLLSADAQEHDQMKGAVCFEDTIRAALDLRDAGVPVQVCYVAMASNAHAFADVFDLCFALGVNAVSYNRMSPTGWAVHQVEQLMPWVDQVEQDLELAERLGPVYDIHVATAMPIPPCLIRIERYQWVQFGFCSVGTHSPNITIDALGNARSCNLSSGIMGNVIQQHWHEIYQSDYLHSFKKKLPPPCRSCAYAHHCQGGCKESAFATYGDLQHVDPFIEIYQQREMQQTAMPSQKLSTNTNPTGNSTTNSFSTPSSTHKSVSPSHQGLIQITEPRSRSRSLPKSWS